MSLLRIIRLLLGGLIGNADDKRNGDLPLTPALNTVDLTEAKVQIGVRNAF